MVRCCSSSIPTASPSCRRTGAAAQAAEGRRCSVRRDVPPAGHDSNDWPAYRSSSSMRLPTIRRRHQSCRTRGSLAVATQRPCSCPGEGIGGSVSSTVRTTFRQPKGAPQRLRRGVGRCWGRAQRFTCAAGASDASRVATRAGSSLLQGAGRPTGVFCFTDRVAMGVLSGRRGDWPADPGRSVHRRIRQFADHFRGSAARTHHHRVAPLRDGSLGDQPALRGTRRQVEGCGPEPNLVLPRTGRSPGPQLLRRRGFLAGTDGHPNGGDVGRLSSGAEPATRVRSGPVKRSIHRGGCGGRPRCYDDHDHGRRVAAGDVQGQDPGVPAGLLQRRRRPPRRAEKLPCILDIDGPNVPNWAWAGYLAPLEGLDDTLSKYLPSTLGKYDDKTYSYGYYDVALTHGHPQDHPRQVRHPHPHHRPAVDQGRVRRAGLKKIKDSGEFEYPLDIGDELHR